MLFLGEALVWEVGTETAHAGDPIPVTARAHVAPSSEAREVGDPEVLLVA